MKKLHGTGVALVTPFLENLEVDYKSLKKLLTHTARGVDYYVVMGTTGESPTVSFEEKKQVLQFVKENNPGKLPIVFGIGGNNTREILQQISETDLSGVSALLSVSPYYSKPSQSGIVEHFKLIADKSPVPVILYNVPGRTSSNITAETTIKLSHHPNIIGTKEASGNFEQCMQIVRDAADGFMLISGDDMINVPLYSIGSKGIISVLANPFPNIFKKMKEYAMAGQYDKARKEQFKLLNINKLMYEEGNPVGVKYVLELSGITKAFVRPPMSHPSADLQRRIKLAYKGMKTRKG